MFLHKLTDVRTYLSLNNNKNMKRLDLLQASTDEKTTQNFDKKVTREKEDLEFEVIRLKKVLKTQKDDIEDRMSAKTPFTVNDVKIAFGPIKQTQEEITDIQAILTEYYSEKA